MGKVLKQKDKMNAFTLVELLVTIGIAAIMMAYALPAFDNMMKNSRLTSTTNLIVGAYNLARSEAVARGADVVVRDIADGWQVAQVAPDVDIKDFEPDSKGITFTPGAFPDVTYSSSGFRPFTDNGVVTIKLCDDRNEGRMVTISPSGMTSVNGAPACP